MTVGRAGNNGTLYVCATPIGNLEDITIRVLKVLRQVDLIAAEDTRKTRILLDHYHIRTPMLSCHQHNEISRAPYLLDQLRQGRNLALLSEAGTPGISDPGERLIIMAINAGLPVVSLPGPTALVSALILSGLPTRRFVFEGFLPRQGTERRRRLRELSGEERTIVFYEAPHRLVETLEDIGQILGNRQAAVARELTKVHEEVTRGDLEQVLEHFRQHNPRGEIVIVISGSRQVGDIDWEALLKKVRAMEDQGWVRSSAVREVAKAFGVARTKLYRAMLESSAAPEKGPL